MKQILSERNLVVILFVLVVVVFVFAQEDTRRVKLRYPDAGSAASSMLPANQPVISQAMDGKESSASALSE
jgi:hypothetical protein